MQHTQKQKQLQKSKCLNKTHVTIQHLIHIKFNKRVAELTTQEYLISCYNFSFLKKAIQETLNSHSIVDLFE